MKKYAVCFLLASAITLSLTGCNDHGTDIIITEGSIPIIFDSAPEERFENTSVTVNTEILETNPELHRPIVSDEQLRDYERSLDHDLYSDLDIFESLWEHILEPIEETETTILAKSFVKDMVVAIETADYSWKNIIDLNKYMDDGYLKDYTALTLSISGGTAKPPKSYFDFDRLEAVGQINIGDITYIAVEYCVQHIDGETNNWKSQYSIEWVGIRNGKIVNQSLTAGAHVDKYLGIETKITLVEGKLYYSFQFDRNPWDSREDVKKIFDKLQSKGYRIEMREY